MARKILLADDSVTAQNMGRKILTDAGYEVVTVNNGSAALKRIAEHKPDLIVLDVYMPGYSGLEVCQRIKENRETARIPVLLTVGKLEPFKPEEARRARADAFVVKPFEASELLATLTRLEDKIVPQPEPYKPGRFAKAFAAVEQSEEPAAEEKFGDSESGWKNRLRFPTSKAKRVEPEPDPEFVAGGKGVRDPEPTYIPVPMAPPSESPAQPGFERPIPAGIPHDITPEEIAAITAAAAKMGGTLAEAPLPPPPTPAEAPPSAKAEEPPEPPRVSETSAPPSLPVPAAETIAEPAAIPAQEASAGSADPVTFASAPALQPEEADVKLPEPAATAAPETSAPPIPAEPVLAEPTAAPAPPEPVLAETTALPEPAEVAPESDIQAAPEPAPPPVPETTAPPAVLVQPPEPEEVQPQPPEPRAESVPTPAIEASVSPLPALSEAASAPPAAADAPLLASEAYFEPKPPVHSEAEVMAALQALIPPGRHGPATVAADVVQPKGFEPATAPPVPEPVVAAAELAQAASGPPQSRWIFEAIAFSPEEAALSLEKEMEKAYAAFAACEAAQLLAASVDAVPTPVATVPEPQPTAIAEPVAASSPAAETLTTLPERKDEMAVEPVPAFSAEPVTIADTELQPVLVPAPAEEVPAPVEPPLPEPEAQVSVDIKEELPVEPATPIPPEAGAVASPAAPEIEPAGGTDDMAKKEWADFRSIKGSGPKAPKTPSKEQEPEVSVKPEPEAAAMAAAASAGGASVPAAPADSKAIASIVDSVLAELRPKIVEEIAKKLADPKKE